MCLFKDTEQDCNHTECSLIKTVRDLNQNVFKQAQKRSQSQPLPTLTTVANSQKNIKKKQQQMSESRSGSIMAEQSQVQNPEASEMYESIINKLRGDYAELSKTVALIKQTLSKHGIQVPEH